MGGKRGGAEDRRRKGKQRRKGESLMWGEWEAIEEEGKVTDGLQGKILMWLGFGEMSITMRVIWDKVWSFTSVGFIIIIRVFWDRSALFILWKVFNSITFIEQIANVRLKSISKTVLYIVAQTCRILDSLIRRAGASFT